MGFGGSVSAMIASLKANRLGKRTNVFDRGLDDSDKRKINPEYLKEPTLEYMGSLMEKIEKQNRKDGIRNMVVAIAILLTAAALLYLFLT